MSWDDESTQGCEPESDGNAPEDEALFEPMAYCLACGWPHDWCICGSELVAREDVW